MKNINFIENRGNAERREFLNLTFLVSLERGEFLNLTFPVTLKSLGKSDLEIRLRPGTIGKSDLEIPSALCFLGCVVLLLVVGCCEGLGVVWPPPGPLGSMPRRVGLWRFQIESTLQRRR